MDDFWSDKRVLVTGGSGFLGRTLAEKLHARGVADLMAPRSSEFDLMQRDQVEKLFANTEPDIVVHLAARVGGIGMNVSRPAELYTTNLLMGTYVIEEARRRSTLKTVLIGTICSYPNLTPVPFKEESLWDGYPEVTNAPYGVAKKALLVHAQANRQQYGQRSVYLMPVNLYGPGDKFHPSVSHVIPALIKKCVEAVDRGDEVVDVWGTGNATREFLYVDDAAEGIALASEHLEDPDPINLGSGQEISIKDLAELIARLSGFEGSLRWDASKPDGQPRRRLDTSRAQKAFGFQARVSLEDGLGKTIEWYRAHRDEAERVTAG
ncbi:MAG: GDP-L-fucose synthase [Actinomycetota bacterium]|nr:GDP-L-fucose synthase [Actinomycetota bacterium]